MGELLDYLQIMSLSEQDIVIVTAHYAEDLTWLCKSPYPVYLCDKIGASPINPWVKSFFMCENAIENAGCEASSYLHFIIQHYHELPQYVAFVHGHEYAWHQQHPLGILGAIQSAKRDDFDYISLNVKTHPGDGRVYDLDVDECVPMSLMRETWDGVFKPYIRTDLPRKFCHDSCAQFLVSRTAILRHPIEAYKQWFAFANTPGSDTYDNKSHAVVLEYIWHIIFGEPPICEERDMEYLLARYNVEIVNR